MQVRIIYVYKCIPFVTERSNGVGRDQQVETYMFCVCMYIYVGIGIGILEKGYQVPSSGCGDWYYRTRFPGNQTRREQRANPKVQSHFSY